MNAANWPNWVDEVEASFCLRLTLTLMHFLWQGFAIALLATIAGWCLRRASANLRHAIHFSGLVIMAACLPLTFALINLPGFETDSLASPVPAKASPKAPSRSQILSDVLASRRQRSSRPTAIHQEYASAVVAEADINSGREASLAYSFLTRSAPYATACYFVGLAALLLKFVAGLWGGHRLRTDSTVDAKLLAMVHRQSRRLRLRITPAIAICRRITAPVVVGVFRPVILLPASLTTNLSPHELEALLIHELAHVRRADLLVNLLQRLIEAVLFFHPAVWYVSRQISVERENACDDCVVSAGWRKIEYAAALVRMAELCAASLPSRAVTLSALGDHPSQFKLRIHRLLDAPGQSRMRLSRAGVLSLVLLLAGVASTPAVLRGFARGQQSRATRKETGQPEQDHTKDAAAKRIPEDVLERIEYYEMAFRLQTEIGAGPIDPDYQRGISFVKMAKDEDELQKRDQHLHQAMESFQRFLKKHPQRMLSRFAREELARVLLARAQVRNLQAAEIEARMQSERRRRNSLQAEARELLTRALPRFKALLDRKNDKLFERQSPSERLRLEMRVAACVEELAATYDEDTARRGELLADAAQQYHKLYNQQRTRMAGLYARLYEGRCCAKLQQYGKALAICDELLEIPADNDAFEKLRIQAQALAESCREEEKQSKPSDEPQTKREVKQKQAAIEALAGAGAKLHFRNDDPMQGVEKVWFNRRVGAAVKHLAALPDITGLHLLDNLTDGNVSVLKQLPVLQSLHLPFANDSSLARLTELPQLRVLTLSGGVDLTNAGLAHISKNPNIEYVNLTSSFAITDDGLKHLAKLPNLRAVLLTGDRLTDSCVLNLVDCTKLKELFLASHNYTDEIVRNASRLRQLARLHVYSAPVTDACLVHLKTLPNLRRLQILYEHHLTGAGLRELGKLTQLKSLGITGAFSDEDLRPLGSLVELEELVLMHTSINGDGLQYLKNLKRLETLQLSYNTSLNDAVIEHLQQLDSLKSLTLWETQVADAGIEGIAQLKQLVTLDVNRTRISAKGFAKLKTLLPKTHVIWSEPPRPSDENSP